VRRADLGMFHGGGPEARLIYVIRQRFTRENRMGKPMGFGFTAEATATG